jgi:hypothetical protein
MGLCVSSPLQHIGFSSWPRQPREAGLKALSGRILIVYVCLQGLGYRERKNGKLRMNGREELDTELSLADCCITRRRPVCSGWLSRFEESASFALNVTGFLLRQGSRLDHPIDLVAMCRRPRLQLCWHGQRRPRGQGDENQGTPKWPPCNACYFWLWRTSYYDRQRTHSKPYRPYF